MEKMVSGKDDGWAWIVCAGAFVALLLETGMVKGLGLLLPALREEFSAYTWVIGLIISLVPGFGAIACIFSSMLSETISHRFTMMLFGLFSSIGLIAGSFATSLPVLLISVLCNGFSVGCEAITIATLPFYFDKHYDLANGISHAGLSVGVMSMPLISQLFRQVYGWRGAFLLLGGLNLQLVVCGSLLRPQKTFEKTLTQSNNDEVTTTKSKTGNRDCGIKKSTKRAYISTLLSMPLFLNFDYLCLLGIFTATGYYYIGWLIYFVPHGEDIGFSPFEASFLATGGGIGNLIGALTFPLAGKFLSGKSILYLSTLITCLSLGLDPIMAQLQSYIGLLISSFGVNFGFAVTDCAIFKEAVDVVEDDDVSNAINWLFVGYSIGSVTSGFLSGWLFDRFGDYSISFLILCMVSALSVSPWIVSDLTKLVKERQYVILRSTDTD